MKKQYERIFTLNEPNAPRINPALACEIGLNESIILLQVEFWISISDNWHDGQKWTYQSVRDMNEKSFPFWSISTINRAVNSLIKDGYLIEGNYNKYKYDKTRWFALNFKKLSELKSISIKGHDTGVCQNDTGSNQNDTHSNQNDTTIPEITTENTPETTKTPLHNSTNCEQMTSPYDLDNRYMEVYLLALDRYGLKKHKRIRDSNLSYLLECLDIISGEVNIFDWQEQIYEYLAELPSGNDGDILAFLRTVKRTFDVDLDDAIDRPNR